MQLATYGCDTFDSCYPTRVGRHGTMLTADGPLRVVSAADVGVGRSLERAVDGGSDIVSWLSGCQNGAEYLASHLVSFCSACCPPSALQISGQYKTAFRPPVEGCSCHTCRTHRCAAGCWLRWAGGQQHAMWLSLSRTQLLGHHGSQIYPHPSPAHPPKPHNNSLAYLHHLVKAKEPLAVSLLTLHNIHFMNQLLAELRHKIMDDEV